MELGGVENVVREIAKRLGRKHKVFLIVRDRPQNGKFEKFWDGVFVIPNSRTFVNFMKSRKFVEKFVRDNKIDVVNFHNWSAIIPFMGCKFPKVLTMHGTSTERFLNQGKWIMAKIMRIAENRAMKSADLITSITKCHMEKIGFKGKFEVIYNGVDTKFFSPKKGARKSTRRKLGIRGLTGIFVGKFMPVKRLGTLLEVAKRMPEVNFIVVGDGEESYLLKNATKNVKWVGAVYDKKKLRDLYSAADFLIITSENEGLPLVLLEGMAMGLPVVASRAGGIPEIVEKAKEGILVDKTFHNFIGGITALKQNPKKFYKTRQYIVKNLNWEQITKDYEKLFASIKK